MSWKNPDGIVGGIAGNIILLIISILVCLGIAEIALRFAYPQGFGHEQPYEGPLYFTEDDLAGFFILDDSYARVSLSSRDITVLDPDHVLRHHDHAKLYGCQGKRDDGRLVIALLGDSVSTGEGVPISEMGEKSFNSILQKKLSESYGREVVVETVAWGGYNIIQIKDMLDEYLARCEPDILIYGFFQNDFYSNRFYRDTEGRLWVIQEIGKRDEGRSSIGKAISGTWIYSLLDKASFGMRYRAAFKGGDVDFTRTLPPIRSAPGILPEQEEAFKGILDAAEERGIPILVVNFPFLTEGYPVSRDLYHLQEVYGFTLFDIRSEFLARGLDPDEMASDLWDPNDVAHYSESGHSQVADILHSYLTERI